MDDDIKDIIANYPPEEKGKYQVLGWMPIGRFAALLESVASQGQVQVPVIQDEHGNTLDGFHRELAASELKLRERLKVQVVGGLSDEEKRHYAISVNLVRRQVSRKERRQIIGNELRRDPKMSNSWLAEICGTTKKTVRSVREELVANGEIPQITRTRRRNGGTYPLPQISAHDKRTKNRAQQALLDLGDDAPRKPISVQQAEGLVRRRKRQERIEAPISTVFPKDCIVKHADFRHLDVADESVDLVLTDPPYGDRFLSEWSALGDFANRILKPGGLLVAYSGNAHLPKVMASLDDHLSYVWTISLRLLGGSTFDSLRIICIR